MFTRISIPVICFLALFLASCSNGVTFKGVVSDADSAMLYLQHDAMSGYRTIDSVRLDASGSFKFTVPQARYPEYYRLMLKERSLVLAIDSLTAEVSVTGVGPRLDEATIAGSEASADIQRLRRSAAELHRVAASASTDSLEAALATHKRMAQSIILSDTHSPAAYYAIYQTVNGVFLFHPSLKEDLPYWTAVATGFDIHYPQSARTSYLKEVVLISQKEMRVAVLAELGVSDTIPSVGAPELVMPDRAGDKVSLSSLKGSVVLLDFSAYAMETAPAHNLFLRELYDEYHSKGFQIYQVSADADKLLWLERSWPMPWVCVRDDAAPRTMSVITYNVTELPTFFLIDREGDVQGRYNHENVAEGIERLL